MSGSHALAARGRDGQAGVLVVADGADAQPDPVGGLADLHPSPRHRPGLPVGHQWPTLRLWARLSCIAALASLRPTICTVLLRAAYLVVMTSRAATEEASQMCAPDRLMTM